MEQARLAIAQLHGTPGDSAQVVAGGPVMPSAEVAPTYEPQYAPQPPTSEPSFPETARGPAFGTSSYVPPSHYNPANSPTQAYQPPAYRAPVYQTPVYQTATAPRYLPPVRPAAPNGAVVR
jgi:hypothetical protein